MAGVKFLGYTILKSATENEIQKLFADYEKTLLTQKQKMCDDITEWGDALIHSISKYVNKQKFLLEQEYANQIQDLNDTSEQFVTQLRAHEQTYNTEQINQLLGLCKALKFELTALEHYGQTIPFIAIRSKEAPASIDQEEFCVVGNKNDNFNNNSTVKDDTETRNNMDAYSKLSPTTTSTSPKRPYAQLSRTKSEDVSNRLINSNDAKKSFNEGGSGFVEKCPICFMIFPSIMIARDRNQHVQEHDIDD